MALHERHRNHLYEQCREAMDEEAAETLMSMLPPVGWADVARRSDLDALSRELRLEMRTMAGELRAEMHALLRKQMQWVTTAILAGMGLAAGVGAGIARLG